MRAYTHQSLIGLKFNRLSVVAEIGKHPNRRDYLWQCRCDCGSEYVVRGQSLKDGKTKSCGCLNDETRAVQAAKIGKARAGKFLIDLRGKKFGRLTPISHQMVDGRSMWLCKCECGMPVLTRTTALTLGITLSCGCYNGDLKTIECIRRNTTHGLSKAPEYQSWSSMVRRCFNPKDAGYAQYGASGRTVCEFLKASPLNLILTIGKRPSMNHEIDRINNELSYTCGTCPECIQRDWKLNIRWATRKENMRNRSNSVLFCIDGVTRCASEWAEKFSLTHCQFSYRYRKHKVVQSG